MRVRMLKTKKGSPDGVTVTVYTVGQDYNIPDNLADVFVNQLNVATEIELSNQEIETPEKVNEIETPEKLVDMETPTKPTRKRRGKGRPRKVKV